MNAQDRLPLEFHDFLLKAGAPSEQTIEQKPTHPQ
jgi:hypothetical protein